MELIEEKKVSETVAVSDKKPLPDNVTDLMSALQASLDKTKKPPRKKSTKVKKEAWFSVSPKYKNMRTFWYAWRITIYLIFGFFE